MAIPKEGWKHFEVIDLGEMCGRCDLCGAALRYKHILRHKEAGQIGIGVECASNVLNGADMEYVRQQDELVKKSANKEMRRFKLIQKRYAEYLDVKQRHNQEYMTFEEYLEAWTEGEKQKKGE